MSVNRINVSGLWRAPPSLPWLSELSLNTRPRASTLHVIIHNTTFVKRTCFQKALKPRKSRMNFRQPVRRSNKGVVVLLMWGRCAITATEWHAGIAHNSFCESAVGVTKGLGHPSLWNCCAGLFILMYTQRPLHYLQSIYNYPALQPNILFMCYHFKNAAWYGLTLERKMINLMFFQCIKQTIILITFLLYLHCFII